MRTCLAGLAVLMAAGIAGCDSGSHAKTAIAASPPTAHSVCKEGFRELETIDRHKLVPEASVFGRLIAEAARESEQVDAHTEARLKRMRPLSATAVPLAYLRHSRTALRRIISTVSRHGIAFEDLPRRLMLDFLYVNSGCGVVKTQPPVSG
jgi:hypothetical protein